MKNRTIFYLIFVLLMMSVILGFSSEDAAMSSNTSGHLAWMLARFIPGFLKRSAESQKEFIEIFNIILREGAHIFTYLCLGISVELFCGSQWPVKEKILRVTGMAILFCVTMAVMDECYQEFLIAGRTFQLIDLAKDWSGSIAGILFISFIRKYCSKKREKSKKIC